MSLQRLETIEERARQAIRSGDYRTAADTLLSAAENTVEIARDTRPGKWRQRMLELSDRYHELAAQIEERLNGRAESAANASNPSHTRSQTSNRAGSEPGFGHKRAESDDKQDEETRNWAMAERPNIALDDVAGMDELKQIVRRQVIEPLQYPELHREYKVPQGFGVLLYGPPGTGKTYIAKAIAGELDCAFYNLDTSIMSKWVGDTEKNLRDFFTQAKSESRSVVFMDEVADIFPRRGSGSTISDRAVGALLTLLSGVDDLSPEQNWLLVIGATNYPNRIDDALLRYGRLGHHVYIGLPDREARRAIAEIGLRGIPCSEEVDLNHLVDLTEGYSAADVSAVVHEAVRIAVDRDVDERRAGRRDRDAPAAGVTVDDLDQGLKKVQPIQISDKMLKDLEKFRQAHQG